MRLNKATSHAIRILVACSRCDGELVKVAEVADELGLTQQNTFKIVHLLSRAGLIAAMRGRYGGVKLAKSADDIRVGDVVFAMEGPAREGDQAASSQGPASAGLPLIDEAFEAFISVLNQNTIADMAAAEVAKPKKKANAKKAGPPKKRVPKVVKSSSNPAALRTSSSKY
jgi:Rrf2 family nitric oxide-sensitive transcriptional repressor